LRGQSANSPGEHSPKLEGIALGAPAGRGRCRDVLGAGRAAANIAACHGRGCCTRCRFRDDSAGFAANRTTDGIVAASGRTRGRRSVSSGNSAGTAATDCIGRSCAAERIHFGPVDRRPGGIEQTVFRCSGHAEPRWAECCCCRCGWCGTSSIRPAGNSHFALFIGGRLSFGRERIGRVWTGHGGLRRTARRRPDSRIHRRRLWRWDRDDAPFAAGSERWRNG